MTTSNEIREKDLSILKAMCSQEKVVGYVANVQFGYLRRKYPWHYILFRQDKWALGAKEYQLYYLVNQFQFKIERIIEYGINEEDVESLELVFNTINKLFKEKKKENPL